MPGSRQARVFPFELLDGAEFEVEAVSGAGVSVAAGIDTDLVYRVDSGGWFRDIVIDPFSLEFNPDFSLTFDEVHNPWLFRGGASRVSDSFSIGVDRDGDRRLSDDEVDAFDLVRRPVDFRNLPPVVDADSDGIPDVSLDGDLDRCPGTASNAITDDFRPRWGQDLTYDHFAKVGPRTTEARAIRLSGAAR